MARAASERVAPRLAASRKAQRTCSPSGRGLARSPAGLADALGALWREGTWTKAKAAARKLALKRWEEIEAGGDDDERARDFLDERDRKISDAFRGDLCFDDDDARFGYFYDDEMDDSADSSDSDEGSELDAPLGERAGHPEEESAREVSAALRSWLGIARASLRALAEPAADAAPRGRRRHGRSASARRRSGKGRQRARERTRRRRRARRCLVRPRPVLAR